MYQLGAIPQMIPQTGLIGSEQAILGGFNGALDSLDQSTVAAGNILGGAYNNVSTAIDPTAMNQAASNFDNYLGAGSSAAKMQSDLLGANGPQAQAAAQQALQGPNQYQIDQVIRNRERSAAARGGLFSGNTGLELNRDLAGLYSQNYQQNFNNLGTVAGQGLNAAGQVAGIRTNQAGIDASLLQQKNNIQSSIASKLAEINYNSGQNKAQLFTQTGQQLGAGRENAGYAIANNVNNTANSISKLLESQGVGVSDMMAQDITTVSNLIHQSGLQDSIDAKTLAQILANISGGQASNVQQGYQAVGDAKAAGILGVNSALQNGLTQGISLGAFTPKAAAQPAQMIGLGTQYSNIG